MPAPPVGSARPRGVVAEDVDRGVDPCNDFDGYANGAWRAANPIPPSEKRWSRRAAAREENRRQVGELLEELARRRDWPRGSVEQRLGDHYAACMDEAAVEAAGVAPLRPLLAAIDAA